MLLKAKSWVCYDVIKILKWNCSIVPIKDPDFKHHSAITINNIINNQLKKSWSIIIRGSNIWCVRQFWANNHPLTMTESVPSDMVNLSLY